MVKHVPSHGDDLRRRVTPSSSSSPDRLLTVAEAAHMLGVKKATLYQWAYQRRIATVKLRGRALRFRLSEIERIMRQDERPALRPRNDPSTEAA